MVIFWLIVAAAFMGFAYYLKLHSWFYIPRDPFSPALESNLLLMERLQRLPKFALRLYWRNLNWRRNRSKNWDRRRNGLPPMKTGTLTKDEVDRLAKALGRPIEGQSRRMLMED